MAFRKTVKCNSRHSLGRLSNESYDIVEVSANNTVISHECSFVENDKLTLPIMNVEEVLSKGGIKGNVEHSFNPDSVESLVHDGLMDYISSHRDYKQDNNDNTDNSENNPE